MKTSRPQARRMLGMRDALLALLMLSLACRCAAKPAEQAVGVAAADVTEYCPPCDMIFRKVETMPDGRRVQIIEMQERGEPKSGTGFMFSWARQAATGACDFLKDTYGQESCQAVPSEDMPPMNFTLTFQPELGDKTCVCEDIDLVRINLRQGHKHELPVDEECRWHHGGAVNNIGDACSSVNGRPVENYADLWACMIEANCHTTDSDYQFIPIRDPRAVAVSTYYHRFRFGNGGKPFPGHVLEEDVMEMLPFLCQWTAVRHILFEGIMRNQSTMLWYDDATKDPVQWFNFFLAGIGVQLPSSIVSATAAKASNKGKLNPHPGGVDLSKGVGVKQAIAERSWRDDVDPKYYEEIDDILRQWLPPLYLTRLGIPFARGG